MLDTSVPDIKEGYPLSSILFNKNLKKYDINLTETDKEKFKTDHTKFVEFISKIVNE